MGGNGFDIGALRKRLNLTQEQLARELGVTVGTVNRWENGHFRPSRLAERELRKLTARVQRRMKRARDDGEE